jgi:hypothetical protein
MRIASNKLGYLIMSETSGTRENGGHTTLSHWLSMILAVAFVSDMLSLAFVPLELRNIKRCAGVLVVIIKQMYSGVAISCWRRRSGSALVKKAFSDCFSWISLAFGEGERISARSISETSMMAAAEALQEHQLSHRSIMHTLEQWSQIL